MAQSRHLENFLEPDIDEAMEYYRKEAESMEGAKRTNALHFLRYFVAYKEFQETRQMPPISDNHHVTRQCLYRVETMLISYINLRHMGRL